jgi:hypothetical protein
MSYLLESDAQGSKNPLALEKRNRKMRSLCLKVTVSVATLFVALSSCTSAGGKDEAPATKILPVDTLSVFMGLPLFAEFYDNTLFVMDIHGEDGLIKAIDVRNDSLLFSFARRGNGPGEYLHVANMQVNGGDRTDDATIGLFDPASKTYRIYSCDSLFAQGANALPVSTLHLPHESRYTELIRLGSGYIATDLTGKGRFVLPDDSLKNERYACRYRPKPVASVPDHLHAMAHHGKTFVSPDGRTIANIIYIAELFSVFRVDHNEVVPAWDYVIREMDYRLEGDNIRTNTPMGYLSGAMDDTCIYGLFCGKEEEANAIATYADEIHVFTYDGKLKEKLQLATPAFGICIDRKERALYAIVHEPEPQIMKYHLPE